MKMGVVICSNSAGSVNGSGLGSSGLIVGSGRIDGTTGPFKIATSAQFQNSSCGPSPKPPCPFSSPFQ